MTPAQHVQPALASAQIHIRDITGSDLRGALADGWDDFKDKRGDIIIIGFAYPVIGLMLAVLALGYSLLPVVFPLARSEEHTSELQSLMRISYAVFCLKKKNIYSTLI